VRIWREKLEDASLESWIIKKFRMRVEEREREVEE